MKRNIFTILMCAFSMSVISYNALAANNMASDRISDIRNTKHNFASDDEPQLPSVSGDRTVKASTENQICVFCHTPHGDPAKEGERKHFLWNRELSSVTDKYTSTSMQASINAPGVSSKMCLSCHDGTVAIGQVDVRNGRLSTDANIGAFQTTGTDGNGALLSDSNSNLGTDMQNDHPIGFTYDSTLATDDKELVDPSTAEGDHIGIRVGSGVANHNAPLGQGETTATTRIAVPLDSVAPFRNLGQTAFVNVASQGSVECTSCHDPHIRSTDNSVNIKFLRLHRFQKNTPTPTSVDFEINDDINCLACHKKAGWSNSIHADATTATQTYTNAAALEREFPEGVEMWQASCLNCHDPHTDTGARWLLRKGSDSSGNSEIENTCFQCHTSVAETILNSTEVKDVETANALGGDHTATDFNSGSAIDLHNITNSDFQETQLNIQTNRHVTCSDCHNPHRIVKNSLADSTGTSGSALHEHTSGGVHTNLLSGALSGTSGVEPDFTAEAGFDPHNTNSMITFTEKFGPAGDIDAVTKEYQVCLKCHSNWGIDQTTGIGPIIENKKSNTAAEFSTSAKSFHPVINVTNNDGVSDRADASKTAATNLSAAFRNAGAQTMYCSDCHDSSVDQTDVDDNVISNTQGPHGASGLLKSTGDETCVDCHDTNQYRDYDAAIPSANSGFSCVTPAADCTTVSGEAALRNNLHVLHSKINNAPNACSDCHVKVPHGWRHKALLADTSDAAAGDTVSGLEARYYPTAKIDISASIPASGDWAKVDCTTTGCHTP